MCPWMTDEVGKGGYLRAATNTPHLYYGLTESVSLAAFRDAYCDKVIVHIDFNLRSWSEYIYCDFFNFRITKHDFDLKYSPRSSVGLERLTVISAVIRRSLVRLMVGRSDISFFAPLWASSRCESCHLVSRRPCLRH